VREGERDVLPNNDGSLLILSFFKGGLFSNKRLRGPFIHQVVDFLFPSCSVRYPKRFCDKYCKYLFRQLHILLLLCRVSRRQQVPHRKHEQEQFDRGAHRVILVAGFDVAQEDGGTGDFVELVGQIVCDAREGEGNVVDIHGQETCREERRGGWWW
jgi:hypothetical protein